MERFLTGKIGAGIAYILTTANADAPHAVIEPGVDEDIVRVSNGHRAFPPCAAALGVRREALNLSGGERVRDAVPYSDGERPSRPVARSACGASGGSQHNIPATIRDASSAVAWKTHLHAQASLL